MSIGNCKFFVSQYGLIHVFTFFRFAEQFLCTAVVNYQNFPHDRHVMSPFGNIFKAFRSTAQAQEKQQIIPRLKWLFDTESTEQEENEIIVDLNYLFNE